MHDYQIAPLEDVDLREVATSCAVMQATTYATYASAGFTGMLIEGIEDRALRLAHVDRCLVAKSRRGNVVGFVAVTTGPEWWEQAEAADFVPPAITRCLSSLFTMPETHGTGLGSALLEAALPDRAPAYLWVMIENQRAVHFYTKHGFAADGYAKVTHGWGNMAMQRMVRLD